MGKEQKIIIQVFFGLNEDEIEKMVVDVEVNKEVDKKFEELIQVCNQVDGMIYVICKQLEEVGDVLSSDDKVLIEVVVFVLEIVVKGEDKVEIEVKIQELI